MKRFHILIVLFSFTLVSTGSFAGENSRAEEPDLITSDNDLKVGVFEVMVSAGSTAPLYQRASNAESTAERRLNKAGEAWMVEEELLKKGHSTPRRVAAAKRKYEQVNSEIAHAFDKYISKSRARRLMATVIVGETLLFLEGSSRIARYFSTPWYRKKVPSLSPFGSFMYGTGLAARETAEEVFFGEETEPVPHRSVEDLDTH